MEEDEKAKRDIAIQVVDVIQRYDTGLRQNFIPNVFADALFTPAKYGALHHLCWLAPKAIDIEFYYGCVGYL